MTRTLVLEELEAILQGAYVHPTAGTPAGRVTVGLGFRWRRLIADRRPARPGSRRSRQGPGALGDMTP